MDISSQSAPRHRRLRDYGAFQSDISALDTLTTTAVQQPEGLTRSASTQTGPYNDTALHQKDNTKGSHSLSSMQKAIKHKWLGWLVRFGITIGLFVYLFKSISWQETVIAVMRVHSGDVLVGLVVGGSGIALSAYQWRVLLRAQRVRFDLADLIKIYIVGITFNHFLPTGFGGDTFKSFYVGRESHNGVGATSATIMCRVTGFFAMMLLVFPILIALRAQVPVTLVLLFTLLCLLGCTIIVGAFLLALILPALSKRWWMQNRFFALGTNMGVALHRSILMPRPMLHALLWGAIFWLVAILNCYVYANAVGIHVQLSFYFIAVPLVAVIANLPISLNGFGVREGVFVYVFSSIHIAATAALPLVFLLDLQSLFFALLGSGIFLTLNSKKIMASIGKDH